MGAVDIEFLSPSDGEIVEQWTLVDPGSVGFPQVLNDGLDTSYIYTDGFTGSGAFNAIAKAVVGCATPSWSSGTAFPGSPSPGDVFERTDLDTENGPSGHPAGLFVYDGTLTAWLPVRIYALRPHLRGAGAGAGAERVFATMQSTGAG